MNDGGPAFPRNVIERDYIKNPDGTRELRATSYGLETDGGMALRDYLAAHAPDMPDEYYWSKMKVKDRYTEAERDEKIQLNIEWRYYYADKMLQQREKK